MEQTDMKMRNRAPRPPRSLKLRGPRETAGFTLIETAFALAVMMVSGLAITSLFLYSINYNAGASDRALALTVAQQRLERLRKTPWSDASLSTASTTETITSAGHPFTVVTTVCSDSSCGGSGTLKVLTVQVTSQGSNNGWTSVPISVSTERATTAAGQYLR
jgi:Tfp pilus assembly protein PilV